MMPWFRIRVLDRRRPESSPGSFRIWQSCLALQVSWTDLGENRTQGLSLMETKVTGPIRLASCFSLPYISVPFVGQNEKVKWESMAFPI